MTTPTTTAPSTAISNNPTESADVDQVQEIGAVGWDGYKRYLRARGERARPKMIYLDGALILVSPGETHQRLNFRFGTLMREVLHGFQVQFRAIGQTRFKRRRKSLLRETTSIIWRVNPSSGKNLKSTSRLIRPPTWRPRWLLPTRPTMPSKFMGVWGFSKLGFVTKIDWRSFCSRLMAQTTSPGGALPYRSWLRSRSSPKFSSPPDITDLEWIDDLRRWVREVLVPRVHPA